MTQSGTSAGTLNTHSTQLHSKATNTDFSSETSRQQLSKTCFSGLCVTGTTAATPSSSPLLVHMVELLVVAVVSAVAAIASSIG